MAGEMHGPGGMPRSSPGAAAPLGFPKPTPQSCQQRTIGRGNEAGPCSGSSGRAALEALYDGNG